MMALSEFTIKALKPKAERYSVSDGQGLGLEVFPSGALAWRYRYSPKGKKGKVALGKYPAISTKAARKRRDEYAEMLAHGKSPSAQKQASKIAPSQTTAGASTVALLSINTEWIFRSRKLAMRALAAFSLLYTFIYVLPRVEAYALLVGALASFAAVAAAMYITRNVDWYGAGGGPAVGATSAPVQGTRDSWLD